MRHKKLFSSLLSFLVVGGAAIYLVVSGFDNTVVYYKTVDELVKDPQRFVSRPVRINGRLVPNSVQVKPGSSDYRFSLTKRGQDLLVAYSGILPDTMKEGQDIVVQGIFDPARQLFVASEVLTKCPSKYEAEASAIE